MGGTQSRGKRFFAHTLMIFSDRCGSGKIVPADKEERGTQLGGYPHFAKAGRLSPI